MQFGVGGGHFHVKPGDKHSLLRPETVESLFVMYRVTHNETYRDWAWNIFRAFEKHSRCAHGAYTSLETVLDTPPARRDSLESFFLAETLKYLLLIFSPDHVRATLLSDPGTYEHFISSAVLYNTGCIDFIDLLEAPKLAMRTQVNWLSSVLILIVVWAGANTEDFGVCVDSYH
jgi:hypothetical protein